MAVATLVYVCTIVCMYVCMYVCMLESACLSELNEDRLCIALLDRLLCVV